MSSKEWPATRVGECPRRAVGTAAGPSLPRGDGSPEAAPGGPLVPVGAQLLPSVCSCLAPARPLPRRRFLCEYVQIICLCSLTQS